MSDATGTDVRGGAVPVALADDAARARDRLAFVRDALAFCDVELDVAAVSGLCSILGDVLEAFDGLLSAL